MDGSGFLATPEHTPEAQRLFDADIDDRGYVMNLSRLWAYQPAAKQALMDLLGSVATAGALSMRQRAVLVAACASSYGDSYCSLAWGTKLADTSDAQTAAGVLTGDDSGLTDSERALAGWARSVARDPNGTTVADVQALRDAGFDDAQIFAITTFVALRIAFSTVNDALGAQPDGELRTAAPEDVVAAITYGRPVGSGP